MGDRRNIVCEFEEAAVAFYTHWSGTEAPKDLQDALKRGGGRRNDPAYLSRIIFCQLVMDDIAGETGYGIEAVALGSTNYCEASSRDLFVNLETQTVRWGEHSWTFEQYVALSEDELDRLN